MIDSHAHYDDEKFDIDRDQVLKDCISHGVTHIVNAGSNIESSKKSIELARNYSFVYAAVGVHPHDASECDKNTIETLKALSEADKVVAIGEIGLDYHYDFSPKEVQREWFARQIALARELKLPIIIHDRESHKDILDIIKSEKGNEVGGVFHCFSGSKEMAQEVLDLGFKIGLGGAITFENAKRPIEVLNYVPLDMLLVETDCPYMTPEPYRGKRNWSGYIELVLKKISEVKEIDYALAEEATSNNAIHLFKL
ncbi:MAG: TatD family hydrolase [Clostridiaceae bacterium]|nr:TatD family hydrolase [Clostridiaceae bacterium]